MAAKTDASRPTAFGIRLGMGTGSNSDPQTIMVNTDTTVNMIFIMLGHIHGKDKDLLEKDFDLYLLRPGGTDIVLNPSRVIADYKIVKNDMLELRHKILPIPICVNLSVGDDRKVEVNSGFPLMDIISVVCKEFGISNHKELSLALPSSGSGGHTMQYEWLDLLNSLYGQGVQQGDTLLLRKKFFIVNDDIQEALSGNEILMELIYQQIFEMYTSDSYVGSWEDSIPSCAKISSLLHHIEQKDENISDEVSISKVMPQHLQKNTEFYGKTVMAYYRERVGNLDEAAAKRVLFNYFSASQSILTNYFPVQKSGVSGDSEELILLVDSDRIKVCHATQEKLEVVDGMNWRLRDLRDTECTSEKDQQLKVNILGNWYEFKTDHRIQISRYLTEAQALTNLRVAKGRVSTINLGSPDISAERKEHPIHQVHTSPALPVAEKNSVTIVVEELVESEEENFLPASDEEKEVPANGKEVPTEAPPPDSSEVPTETPPDSSEVPTEAPPTEAPPTDAPPTEDPPTDNEVPSEALPGIPPDGGEVPPDGGEAPHDEEEERQHDADINEPVQDISEIVMNSSSNSPQFVVPPPPPSLASTPHHKTPPKFQPSPSKSTSKSTYIHIPEFLGLDYRKVLEDYRLFHVVVMKNDVRTLLLHIRKPVQEIIDSLCATFDIPNPSNCYLYIPAGIQTIIEKYGGKPKSRAGKFVKQQQVEKDFAPKLVNSKSLKEQYNFTIKPFLLHVRRFQPTEGVDGDGVDGYDATDYGTEWPEFEHPDVARYRSFYQSWTGIVQGAFPIEKKGAVRLAAMLTQIYFGGRREHQVWPPRDYDAKIFLPERLQNSFGIVSEVEKVYLGFTEKKVEDCIHDVVTACQQLSTMKGVFFEVTVPVKSDIFSLIPRKKMEERWFGIGHNGVFSIDMATGEIDFTHKLSAIDRWSSTENSFKLIFIDRVFDAYTYQAKEIMDTLELFVQIGVRKGKGEDGVGNEPEKKDEGTGYLVENGTGLVENGTGLVESERENGMQKEDEKLEMNVKSPTQGYNGTLDTSPHKGPLNLDIDRMQSLVSPTTYDL